MTQEESPKNNTRDIPSRYTPEEDAEMDEMARLYVEGLNSAVQEEHSG